MMLDDDVSGNAMGEDLGDDGLGEKREVSGSVPEKLAVSEESCQRWNFICESDLSSRR